MSQRRTVKAGDNKDVVVSKDNNNNIVVDNNASEELTPFVQQVQPPKQPGSLSLDKKKETTANNNSLSAEERLQHERHLARLKYWRESPFAVGLVNCTWADELAQPHRCRHHHHGDDELNPDNTGCLCCSARVCAWLGAGRVGNMAVLKSSTEWVEEVVVYDDDDDDDDEDDIDDDEEQGGQKQEITTRRYTRPRLDCVVGPYWPMLVFVTYPLIFGVSGWTFVVKIWPGTLHPTLILIWTCMTCGLITALACTGCRDPGIQYRYDSPPPQYENSWRWSDRAYSFRARDSFYDTDTAVVVEGFDHTCPWTGTAIGRKNMFAFQMFVCLVFLCMLMDIFILTGVFDEWKKH